MRKKLTIKETKRAVWICADCAKKHCRRKCGLATWHTNECDICHERKAVTEPRDFGGFKPRRIRRKKRGSRSYYKQKADDLWPERILERNNGYCEVCSTEGAEKEATQPHHIIGKKNLTLRHDLKNGCALCYTHHLGGNLSAHNDPMWFMEWLHKNREADYNYLHRKQRDLTFKVDYQSVIEKLKKHGEINN